MSKIRVMISSTEKDLEEERGTVDSAIKDFHFERYRSEVMDSKSHTPKEVCDEMARNCDIFILVIGESYGRITEREFEIAKESNPDKIFVFVKNIEEGKRDEKEIEFMKKVMDFDSGYFRAKPFSNCEELYSQVKSALNGHINEAINRYNLSTLDVLSLPIYQKYQGVLLWGIIIFLIISLLAINSLIHSYLFPTFESLKGTILYKLPYILKALNNSFLITLLGFFAVNITILALVMIFSSFPKQITVVLCKISGTIIFLLSIFIFLFWYEIFGFTKSYYLILSIWGMIFSYYLTGMNLYINNMDNSLKFSAKSPFIIITMNYIINRFIPFQIPIIFSLLFLNEMIFMRNESTMGGLFLYSIMLFDFTTSYVVIAVCVIIMVISYFLIRYYQGQIAYKYILNPIIFKRIRK
jgi:hypothetical protein